MTWFMFSLLSIVSVSLADLVQQHLLKSNKIEAETSTSLTMLFQAFFTIPIILILGIYQNFFTIFNPNIFPYFILVSIIGSSGVFFYFKSLKATNISISIMFVALSMVVSTTFGVIFFDESLYPSKLIGIALILIAIISVSIKNLQLEKANLFGLLTGVLFGISYTLDKKIITEEIHPLVYIFWGFSLTAFFGFLYGHKIIIKNINESKLSDYKILIISALGYFFYNLFTFIAYTIGGEVGRIDAINNSQVFLIILAEYFILKNKDGIFRKIITSIIAFSGVAILGLL